MVLDPTSRHWNSEVLDLRLGQVLSVLGVLLLEHLPSLRRVMRLSGGVVPSAGSAAFGFLGACYVSSNLFLVKI